MKIENHKDNLLYGAIGFKNCVAELGLMRGVYQCKIKVNRGVLTLKHYSYDLQIGSWCNPPKDGEEIIRIQEGESRIVTIHCDINDGQPDEIIIANDSWTKKATFHIDIDTVFEKKESFREKTMQQVA